MTRALSELFPADDFDEPDAGWFLEPKDKLPATELQRQMSFLALLKRLAPSVDALAIPNAGKSTEWERIQRYKEGARRGALDLTLTWEPTRPNDRGVFFAEMKNGTSMPTIDQRERLNRYFKQGHGCGVFRRPETLVEHLRAAGAPFIGRLT